MKRDDSERASILLEALGDLDKLSADLRRKRPRSGYRFVGMMIETGDYDRNGDGSMKERILVDRRTARRIVPVLEELRALGVNVE